MKIIRLSKMDAGQEATVVEFVDQSTESQRIQEMGVTPGEKIELIRFAPMGDPIEIRVRGYLLTLRKEEADNIKVSI